MLENVIEWLNDRNNVTLLIAIAGFALSLWNMVEAQLKNRKNEHNNLDDADAYMESQCQVQHV